MSPEVNKETKERNESMSDANTVLSVAVSILSLTPIVMSPDRLKKLPFAVNFLLFVLLIIGLIGSILNFFPEAAPHVETFV